MATSLSPPLLEPRLELSAQPSIAPFYVSGEDNLRVTARNAAAGVTLTIAGRFLNTTGEITPFVHLLTPATDRSASTVDARLGHGWLVNLSVAVSAGTPQVGETFVRAQVIRGLGGATIALATLAQGYATEADDLAWPGSAIRASTDGPGVIRSVAGVDPGPNAETSVTVPTGARWRPLLWSIVLLTDATVANRESAVVLTDGAATLAHIPSGVTQVASQSRRYTYGRQSVRGAGTVHLHVIAPLPDLQLAAGSTIGTSTAGLQAGDDYAAPQLLVEEWIEP